MQHCVSEISVIKKICSDLYTEFGNLNNGGYGVFAKAMNEKFKTNSFLYVFEKDAFDEDPPIHVYLKLQQGKYIDVFGFYTKKNIYEYYGWNSLILEDEGDILNACYEDLGEGLFVIDYKNDY